MEIPVNNNYTLSIRILLLFCQKTDMAGSFCEEVGCILPGVAVTQTARKCHHAVGTLSFPSTSLSARFIAVWQHKQNYCLSPSNDSKYSLDLRHKTDLISHRPQVIGRDLQTSLKGTFAPVATSQPLSLFSLLVRSLIQKEHSGELELLSPPGAAAGCHRLPHLLWYGNTWKAFPVVGILRRTRLPQWLQSSSSSYFNNVHSKIRESDIRIMSRKRFESLCYVAVGILSTEARIQF